MQAVLMLPGGGFALCIEPPMTEGMSNDVVNGSKSVVGTSRPAIEEGMKPIPVRRSDGDLEPPVADDGGDQFIVRFVGLPKEGKIDSDADGARAVGQQLEETISLVYKLVVRSRLPGDHPVHSAFPGATRPAPLSPDLPGADQHRKPC